MATAYQQYPHIPHVADWLEFFLALLDHLGNIPVFCTSTGPCQDAERGEPPDLIIWERQLFFSVQRLPPVFY